MSPVRLGVDVGGTFTDLVAVSAGALVTAKVPSTPADQSEGVMLAASTAELDPDDVEGFAHGMTVATNALLERRGARTALVTTERFRDLLEIGRQDRPSLYDLTRDRPPVLVPRELRFTVRERMGPEGELEPLDERSVNETIAALRDADVEAVAVCLLFSFAHPEHERRVAAALGDALPGVHVTLSSEVLPEFREYERFSTATADAYLSPRLGGYLGALAERVAEARLPAPLVMQSSGGVIELEAAARHAAGCVLSGPAGGVVGAAYVAEASGLRDVLSFDMGGTSTDVAPIVDGEARTTTESVVAGVPIKLPMVDLHTVSAGGGSIARADAGGALRVGPESAGAEPGPAAYGRGGDEPTVTDADLFLGYLGDGTQLGGELELSRERAERALEDLGGKLGLDALDTALGVVRVADSEMVRALRVISVERGLDPRRFALAAFGGAGGMHACALAEELGMTTVLVPRAAGVLSALGLAVADLRRDYVRPLRGPLERVEEERLRQAFEEMEALAERDLEAPRLERRADLRYARQSFELSVAADDFARLAERFGEAHERRYGYRAEGEPVELVNARLKATVERDRPPLKAQTATGDARRGARRAHFGAGWVDVEVLAYAGLREGARIAGPAIVEADEATCVIRPGWNATIDGSGSLVLERE